MAHHYGWKRDLPDYRDYYLSDYEPTLTTVPTLVDLRSGDSPIRDQGQLGSCTAFTGEGAFHFETKKQGLPDFLGSPLYLYYKERVDQGTVGQDSGASIREISRALSSYGIASEADWPYIISKFTTQPSGMSDQEATLHKATQYLSVMQNLDQMRSCLASGYPIMVGFSVYGNFESQSTATTGMVQMPSGSLLGGHANLLLGYDDSRQVFISRNSWGTGFGDHGYLYFPYSYLLNSGLASDFWTLRVVTGVTPIPPPPPPVPPTPTPVPVTRTHTVNVYSDGSVQVQ